MRNMFALMVACALMIGSAAAQSQYPQTTQPQPYPQTAPAQQQYPQAGPTQQAYPETAAPAAATQNAIPAGTQLTIRTNENIVADKSSVGRQYSAEIAQNVMGANGQLLVPKGSPATLTVNNISQGTLGVGSNEVALGLQSVTVNGQTYNIAANPVTQSGNRGIGANKRTAEMTGGGALLGTLIGAVVGGGKGAAIGAVTGAGAGATAQVLTRGKEVKVPAESLLTFRLDQPLTLQR
ncbi:MAG: hypothetical protein ACE14M_02005 [Terriglobales bacterium]